MLLTALPGSETVPRSVSRHKISYGGAVDVERAADLYAQGWTLRQIGAELGVTATTVSHQLRSAGVTMRRGGASAHPASTQQILELAARRAAHSLAALGRARVLYVPGANEDANAGDGNHLVLAKPNVIMNDTRLRGLEVAGSDAAGRRNPHNHAQTARNLNRSLRNAAAGARLIQADGLE